MDWAWRGLEETQLSVVPAQWSEHVRTTKLLAVIANVLLDDLADVPGRELAFQASIDRLMGIRPADTGADLEGPYFDLLFALWQEIEDRARMLPGWDRYQLLRRFDYEQDFAAMRYVVLTRSYRGLDNLAEHRAYLPHNMNVMVFATLDLMSTPQAAQHSAADIGLVRESAWHAQALTQISTMVVTRRREVAQRDFSSRIFPLARDAGIVSHAELQALAPREIVARIEASNVEHRLLAELRSHRARVAEMSERESSIDMRRYAHGIDQVVALYLASKGLV
ncbi:MAG: hypothetical protein QOJ63_2239 [Solirubrobacteraceae bacterium]|nr:hypothetical protein [Solirubrobacteraceae bacterium]